MSNKRLFLSVAGLLVLYSVISLSIYSLLRQTLPEYSFFFGIDEDGESFDRKLTFASMAAVPLTSFIILGFNAWRHKWDDNDYLIREIDEEFNIVNKLKSEVRQNEYDYRKKKLIEKIEKAIKRTYE